MQTISVRCCIAGAGPAGMMAGLLLARAGVDVVVLEKHGDFLRDFRGDTIHPSTLELHHELGFLDAVLESSASEGADARDGIRRPDGDGRRFHTPQVALPLYRIHAAMAFSRLAGAACCALSDLRAQDAGRGRQHHRRRWPGRRARRHDAARGAGGPRRSRHRRRWPRLAGARKSRARRRGPRRADGRPVVRPA